MSGEPRAQAEIPEPQAHRGEIPMVRYVKPMGPFPWKKHRELAIALPPTRVGDELRGGWVLVGEAKRTGDGPKERSRQIWNLKKRLETHLDRRYPLERYHLRVTRAEGAYNDRELWMRYLGELTPEEDELDRKRKRGNYEAMMAHRKTVKARRALESRRRGGTQG